MAGALVVFFISIVICCALAYILGLFWFSDIRNRRLSSFFWLGFEVFAWTLLNAISIVSGSDFFPFVYTLRMVLVCIVPFGAVWFILDFVGAPPSGKRWLAIMLFCLPLLDIAAMVSNPLHHLYFSDYLYPIPTRAPLFWVHMGMDFLFILIGFVFLLRFIIKGARRNPVLILTGVAMLIPYGINMFYSFGIMTFGYDITPIGFFVTLLLFVYAAHKLQLLNIKTSLFTSTMDSLNDIIILFTSSLTVAEVNRQALQAFSDFSFIFGRTPFSEFIQYLENHVFREKPDGFLGSLKTRHIAEGECAIALPDGQLRSYELVWHEVRRQKKRTGYILMLSDVSRYKEMIGEIHAQNQELLNLKERAEAASRTKGEFLSRMSHEMRTPMNAIIGMAQIALNKAGLPNELKKPLEKIQGASTHLLGVINDVLDMSKIEAGKFILSESEYTIDAILANISVVLDIHAEQKQQSFTVETDDDLPPVLWIDGQHLMQVITNLLSNAFKFSPVNGKIRLSIRVAERSKEYILLRFEVEDNGIGTTAEQKTRLFNAFEQADGSTSRTYGGTGLGLTISKNIVEQMGGKIWVEDAPVTGSRFVFTARARIIDKATRHESDLQRNVADMDGAWKDCRILLVEDIEINREVLMALLDGSGVQFDIAENGRVAYEKYMAAPDGYDIIFMDLQMPEMDGFTATEAIRKSGQRTAEGIPIIAMTANAFKEDIEKCLSGGMNDHLAKPIEVEKVLRIIEKYFGACRPKQQPQQQ